MHYGMNSAGSGGLKNRSKEREKAMRTKFQGMLAGAALLGASAMLCAQPVLAGPKVGKEERKAEHKQMKEARKEVRKERKEFRKADTRSERLVAKEGLRDAQHNRKSERRDVWQARHKNSPRANRRYDTNRGYVPSQRDNTNRRSDFSTIEGTVTNDLRGNACMLRANGGQLMRVQVQGGEPNRISRGDRVRVSGFSTSGVFQAQSLTMLHNR